MKIIKNCEQCGKVIERYIKPSAAERTRFCDKDCRNEWMRIHVWPFHKAPWLHDLNVTPGRNAAIARENANKIGDAQRGRVIKHGKSYTKRNGRHEHRRVMEQHIGRPLRSDEHVHHIDGNVKNNKLENLQLLSREEHASITAIAWHRKMGHKIHSEVKSDE